MRNRTTCDNPIEDETDEINPTPSDKWRKLYEKQCKQLKDLAEESKDRLETIIELQRENTKLYEKVQELQIAKYSSERHTILADTLEDITADNVNHLNNQIRVIKYFYTKIADRIRTDIDNNLYQRSDIDINAAAMKLGYLVVYNVKNIKLDIFPGNEPEQIIVRYFDEQDKVHEVDIQKL